MVSDRVAGALGLIVSLLFVGYLFMRLIILPILPLDDDNIFKMGTPIGLLLFLGFLGFIFIGFLSMYTLYMLYVGDGNIKVRKHNKFLYG